MIYVIHQRIDGRDLYKVGKTIDLERRLRELERDYGSEIRLVTCWDGGIEHERATHLMLATYRVWQRKRADGYGVEWFAIPPDLLQQMREHFAFPFLRFIGTSSQKVDHLIGATFCPTS